MIISVTFPAFIIWMIIELFMKRKILIFQALSIDICIEVHGYNFRMFHVVEMINVLTNLYNFININQNLAGKLEI